MAIQKATLETFRSFLAETDKRYAKTSDLGALASKNEVGESELSSSLLSIITGKADKATTLAGYGITDAMTSSETAQAIAFVNQSCGNCAANGRSAGKCNVFC